MLRDTLNKLAKENNITFTVEDAFTLLQMEREAMETENEEE